MASAGTPSRTSRIVSLDQFRGYTVAGMILVNYIGSFHAIDLALNRCGFGVFEGIFAHHDTYFSYADTIMPGFHFAVGFALRLTLLQRLKTLPKTSVYLRVVRRCLGLVLLSTVLELGTSAVLNYNWQAIQNADWPAWVADFFKCAFWETLAIIGVTSIWVLPVITRRAWIRILFVVASLGLHVVLSHFFYFNFMWARPNWLDSLWGAAETRGLDGGPLGFLMWGVVQVIGSLAYDVVAKRRPGAASLRIFTWAVILMAAGYAASCLTTFYNVAAPTVVPGNNFPVAESPVLPANIDIAGKPVESLLAEPPFVMPPPPEERPLNYWMMSKRATTMSFILFSSGFSLAIYSLFVVLSDICGTQIGVFRTFGSNALAAYVIHGIVEHSVRYFVPDDAPLGLALGSFAIFAGITYLFVRHLEKSGIYLRM
jgi:predicted acyltransferase